MTRSALGAMMRVLRAKVFEIPEQAGEEVISHSGKFRESLICSLLIL